jgi:hypothetical protein
MCAGKWYSGLADGDGDRGRRMSGSRSGSSRHPACAGKGRAPVVTAALRRSVGAELEEVKTVVQPS